MAKKIKTLEEASDVIEALEEEINVVEEKLDIPVKQDWNTPVITPKIDPEKTATTESERLEAVYAKFQAQSPEKWELEKDVLLAKLEEVKKLEK